MTLDLAKSADRLAMYAIRWTAESEHPDRLWDNPTWREARRTFMALLLDADPNGASGPLWRYTSDAAHAAVEARQLELLDLVDDQMAAAMYRPTATQAASATAILRAALANTWQCGETWPGGTPCGFGVAGLDAPLGPDEDDPIDEHAEEHRLARELERDNVGVPSLSPVDVMIATHLAALPRVPVTVSEMVPEDTLVALGQPVERFIVHPVVAGRLGLNVAGRIGVTAARRRPEGRTVLRWAMLALAVLLFAGGLVLGATNPTPLNGRTLLATGMLATSLALAIWAPGPRNHR